jgi:DNA invertase Pin-like site-specific DNA recombinase
MGERQHIDREDAEEVRHVVLSANSASVERAAARRRRVRSDATPSSGGPPARDTPVIGYASCLSAGRAGTLELKQQASAIAKACDRRGLRLTEVVWESEPATRRGLGRPGLAYALEQLQSGDAKGLVVAELSRLTYSAAELGKIIEWLSSLKVRLVASAQALDTECEAGRLAAEMLIEVSRWERARLSERTRNGLHAARMSGKSTGRGAVTDNPDLSERIAQMRAQGMTLQAIADQFNEEGVPTVRGGSKWRHSSVQTAAGYRRRSEPLPRGGLRQRMPVGEQASG